MSTADTLATGDAPGDPASGRLVAAPDCVSVDLLTSHALVPPKHQPSNIRNAEYGSLRVFLRLVQVSPPMRLQLLLDAAKDLASTHDQGLFHGDVSCATVGVCDAIGGGYKASLSAPRDLQIEDKMRLADAQTADVCAFGSCLIEAYRGLVDAKMDLSDRRPETMPVDLWTLANGLTCLPLSERKSIASVVATLGAMVQQTQTRTAYILDDVSTGEDSAAPRRQRRKRLYGLGLLVAALICIIGLCVAFIPSSNEATSTSNAPTPTTPTVPTPTPMPAPSPAPTPPPVANRSYTVSTFVGNGVITNFTSLKGITGDAYSLFVADSSSSIMRIDLASNKLTPLAGSASSTGFLNGVNASARFLYIGGLALASDGTLLVADAGNNAVRTVDARGVVATLAGTGATGSADGSVSAATFHGPMGIAVGTNRVLVADTNNAKVRSISAGTVSTFSGPGAVGPASIPTYNVPLGVAEAPSGLVYITDGNLVRKIGLDGSATDIGSSTAGHADGHGASAAFNEPHGIVADSDGIVFVVDTHNHCIRAIDTNDDVITIAGTPGVFGNVDGAGSSAAFNYPQYIYIDASGALYVTDPLNLSVRRLVYT
ncbi:hypothetical protein SDRG_04989 [Saprolegnia diclina VS20]|uniref:Uncharacterized protein n=1 Tax=Saprolegnia diclina (strain VS20) TaxID=1156394 RepID=T0QTQ0_SAPDV|nr:hypothetical protein SDRG_04989 [Saprolegnia diclina VS20]EQC37385.1 hypothetical protein SDRG_04989 [Saprolegnia diclina VS20]|eukprot:XP_008608905.1 hypothetical protein SDRG_04989 [Saprolegnia diclina VS20]